MTSAIRQAFENAARQGRAAFIPFITAGFPDAETCLDILTALDENGADVIELGLPFSDPLADGPVIQKSSHLALERGATPDSVLDLAARASSRLQSPLVVMSYWNPILNMGAERFAERAASAGVSGVIIPDLPMEEADSWNEAARAAGIETIFMVAPNTPIERRRRLALASRGFLYFVSLTGVTGAGVEFSNGLLAQIEEVRREASLPVAVGFGVSTPEQARALAAAADGVIVGSALIREILSHDRPEDQIAAAAGIAGNISRALGRQERI